MYVENFRPIYTMQELIDLEDAGETHSILEAARIAQQDIARLLPNDRKLVLEQIARLPSPRPLIDPSIGKIDPFEFTRRMVRLLESSRAAVKCTSEKPRPHPDKGGWHGLRLPTPGAYSGARREPSTAWHGEMRS